MITESEHFKKYGTLYVLAPQIAICIIAFYFIPCLYKTTISKSDIFVNNEVYNIDLVGESPSWFKIDSTTIHTNKAITDEEKQNLLSLVAREDSMYQTYYRNIDKLVYKSNNDTTNYCALLLLTLCFITMGCVARSFYDFIGHCCYKDGQDMVKWWPWYVYRPLIGVPIATFLIVAARTAIFSNIFTARDLCTYLVVSFLAGFSMMEFLKMLRRVSKSLFGNDN